MFHYLMAHSGVTVGGMQTRPAFDEDGEVVPRQFMNFSIAFDHDIVDGAPAARFSDRFIKLIESGSILLDEARKGEYGKTAAADTKVAMQQGQVLAGDR